MPNSQWLAWLPRKGLSDSLIFSQFALPFSKTILEFPETVKRFVLTFLHQPSLRRHDAARNVGGVVGVAMNSVLLVHEHPEEPASMLSLFGDCESEYQYPILSPNWHFPSYSPKLTGKFWNYRTQ